MVETIGLRRKLEFSDPPHQENTTPSFTGFSEQATNLALDATPEEDRNENLKRIISALELS